MVGEVAAAFLTGSAMADSMAVGMAAVMVMLRMAAVNMVGVPVRFHPYHNLLGAAVIHVGSFGLGGHGNACNKGKQHHFEHILVHVRW